MRLIVTGGCGFIGSNFLIKAMRDTNLEILNLDSLSYASNREFTRHLEENVNYKFIQTDIRNKNDLKNIIFSFKPHLLVNFAAETHVDNSISSPEIFIDSNIKGVFSLLEVCSEYSSKENKDFRLVHISTDEVFGDLGKEKKASSEDDVYLPSSPYSSSKASSDLLVMAWSRTYGLNSVITNCSNNFGPRQHSEKLIPKIISNALNHSPIPIYNDGKNLRDWIYVEDHIECLLKIIKSNSLKSLDRFNIGGGNQIDNNSIVLNVLELIEKKLGINDLDELIEYVDDRPGHDFRYELDSSKARKELNWVPRFQFKEALDKTVDWYIKQITN